MEAWTWNGARVLSELHARRLREFVDLWKRARVRGLELPEASRADYGSWDGLLIHVLGSAGSYLVWVCEELDWPRPAFERDPEPAGFAARADAHLEAVLAAWDSRLRALTEQQADGPARLSRWGTPYCIDAMLEHAVMHPVRHGFQLEGWLEAAEGR